MSSNVIQMEFEFSDENSPKCQLNIHQKYMKNSSRVIQNLTKILPNVTKILQNFTIHSGPKTSSKFDPIN